MNPDFKKGNGLTARQTGAMAAAAGICVANIYYNQPILKDIARSLGVSETRIGLVAVLTQCGYGLRCHRYYGGSFKLDTWRVEVGYLATAHLEHSGPASDPEWKKKGGA